MVLYKYWNCAANKTINGGQTATQSAFTFPKSTKETPEKCVKSVQS